MIVKQVKCKFIMNPFFWFTLVWTCVLLVHSLGIMTVYPSAPIGITAFFLIVLILSVFFGALYQRRFLSEKNFVVLDNDKPNWIWISACALGFLLEVVYSGMIPILEVLRHNTSSYQNFGIPHITFVIVSMTIALNAVASVKLFYGTEHKLIHALTVIMCLSIFLLSYSRGILIFSFLITLVVFLSKFEFRIKNILFVLALGIIGSLLFNIAGNLRQNSAINDSSYIMALAGFKEEYSFLSPFSWVLTYVDTPLGNLCYNYVNVPSLNSFSGLLSQLIPDFISKRVFPQYDSSLYLIQPGLTASSMFAGGYKYFGLFGMSASYLELVAMIFISARVTFKNTKCFLATTASLCIIAAMTFFDNMVTYSGYSFFLIFLIIYRLVSKDDSIVVAKISALYYLALSDEFWGTTTV